MTMGHYLRSMRQLTNQWSPTNFRDDRRQRLYLKDIDCPPEWFDHLRKTIPPNVLYMNHNVSDNPSVDARNDDDIFGAPEPTAAVAGDLMSCLPEEMRAQNLMCYIGHEGTYTPAHKEMCASLGQNIMVDASSGDNGDKPGSSVWFMTETKDREVIREYFLSMLGHDVEVEKHFAQINAWKKANFPVYVVEQKVGDFILVPPLAPHQVWNRGTRTVKVAWNRTTVETLDLALHEALPRSRLVCRDEQYKNKAIIYFALEKYYNDLQNAEDSVDSELLGFGGELTNSPRLKQMAGDFRRLFGLFTEILVDEMFGYKHIDTELIEFDSNITCSYCRSNIFNRFLTCKCCVRQLVNGDEDTYDICMECYAMGRSCVCISGLQWCEQWQWSRLVEKHETWRAMVIKQDGFIDLERSPQPLEIARKKASKKSIAQICQEQLRRRPWNDITKPAAEPVAEDSEPEPEVDDEGRVKKKSKPKRKVKKGDTYRCHVCCHKDYTYRLNFCTTCQEAYCYGVLFRAFDTMPQTAMEQEHWQCPRCLGICNCGSCRRSGNTNPYVPKSTLLGHDTRKVADDRSVEAVVDFRIHNLSWLKGAGEETRSKNSKRMQRLVEQADAEKARDPLAGPDAAEDAPHQTEDSALQSSIMDADGSQGYPAGAGANQVPVADMSMQNGEGDPAYPDPSAYPSPAMGGRMMGMGFYDQDDSADRILFDAFQMPSADTLDNEPEVSEFVKKTLRMAKRKARLETDDDPDFQGPRSHHRKKPKTGNIDQLVNLDPALLGTLGNHNGSQTATSARPVSESAEGSADPSAHVEATAASVDEPPQKPTRPPLPIEPLNPTLRHAKPTQSYVEAEEVGEDPDDMIAVDSVGLFGTTEDALSATNDPIDLAAEAIHALAKQDEPPAASSTPQTGAKRRGRPPGRPRASLPSSAPTSTAKAPKKRGRPPGSGRPKESQTNQIYDEDTVIPDAPAPSSGGDAGSDLEADLEAVSARNDDDSHASSQRQPSTGLPTRRRGRPAGRTFAPPPVVDAEPEPVRSPVVPRMLSMKERMAARGKAFRMRGARTHSSPRRNSQATLPTRSPASETPTTTPSRPKTNTNAASATELRGRKELLDDDFETQAIEDSSSASSSDHDEDTARRPVRSSAGLTVVRMEQSEDSSSSSDSDSIFGDDDDEGIPAKPRYTATRGGRGRPRGSSLIASSGRGRGRGRPRGRGW